MTIGDICAQVFVLTLVLAILKAWPHLDQFSDGNVGAEE